MATKTLKPRVTEKSAMATSKLNVYTFDVAKGINKSEIAKSVKATYKVTPLKVSVINTPGKMRVRRGKKIRTAPVRKAMIYLKSGDKIDL